MTPAAATSARNGRRRRRRHAKRSCRRSLSSCPVPTAARCRRARRPAGPVSPCGRSICTFPPPTTTSSLWPSGSTATSTHGDPSGPGSRRSRSLLPRGPRGRPQVADYPGFDQRPQPGVARGPAAAPGRTARRHPPVGRRDRSSTAGDRGGGRHAAQHVGRRLLVDVGGTAGGGFEWTAGPDHGGLVGITALELDADQLITKVTSVYDSRQLSPARRAALVLGPPWARRGLAPEPASGGQDQGCCGYGA